MNLGIVPSPARARRSPRRSGCRRAGFNVIGRASTVAPVTRFYGRRGHSLARASSITSLEPCHYPNRDLATRGVHAAVCPRRGGGLVTLWFAGALSPYAVGDGFLHRCLAAHCASTLRERSNID
jgi:hypothetical protein